MIIVCLCAAKASATVKKKLQLFYILTSHFSILNAIYKRTLMQTNREHNKWIALALCILLGYLGLHRFYEGKIWTGILWLCTGGLCGVGIVVDAIFIVLKPEKY